MRTLVVFLLVAAGLLVRPASAQLQYEILVLSIPNKYHFEYIGVARPAFERLAKHHHFGLTWTNDPQVFEGDLSKYAAIVFLNTPGEELNETQRARFTAYLRAGGGFVGVHKTIAANRQWPWFERLLGQSFRIHPLIQTAVVHVVDRTFLTTMPLPDRWIWTDEWYEFDPPYSNDLKTVLTVDKTTYDPTKIWPGQVAKGMGAFHPVAWYHRFEGVRSFVTALGHNPELYNDRLYLEHLYGGIYWAATGRGLAPGDAAPPPPPSP